jgi:hypothetical protein
MILKSRVPEKCDLKHFWGEILKNSEDQKVHQKHDFYDLINVTKKQNKCNFLNFSHHQDNRTSSQTLRHFSLELNELGKSPWKTGGESVSCSSQLHGGEITNGKSQCDFDQKFCI